MEKVEDEDRFSVRAKMAKEKGFTGLSILHRLFNLYGFDLLHDMVFDAMHNISLNVVNQHLRHFLQTEMLPRAEVESRLNSVPWTTGL